VRISLAYARSFRAAREEQAHRKLYRRVQQTRLAGHCVFSACSAFFDSDICKTLRYNGAAKWNWIMFGILGLGFLLGLQHALEADHVAAVSSIAARRSHVGDIVKHGLTWGIGHTLTLLAFGGAPRLCLARPFPKPWLARSSPPSASC
jgi:high-affinity nickel permease